MHLKLTAADKSDVGKQREQNEDCAYKRVESSEDGDLGLFVVADGMGGYKAGEVASKLAIDTIRERLDALFKPVPDQPTVKLDLETLQKALNSNVVSSDSLSSSPSRRVTDKLPGTSISAFVEKHLESAVEEANSAIVRYGERQSHARGLGSTVTVALVQNDQLYLANVGDSRTYCLRKNVLTPLTKDHSLVAKLIESKQITEEEAYTHPQRNLIYRSLGAGHKNVEVDIFHEALQPDDKLLLCSDGLWEMVHHQELLVILSEHASPQVICDKLIERANVCGGEDNITAIVVHVSTH
jgi:PPM family protein phosphatase